MAPTPAKKPTEADDEDDLARMQLLEEQSLNKLDGNNNLKKLGKLQAVKRNVDDIKMKKEKVKEKISNVNETNLKLDGLPTWQSYHKICTDECIQATQVMFTSYLRNSTKWFIHHYSTAGTSGGIVRGGFESETHKKLYEYCVTALKARYITGSNNLYMRCPHNALLTRPLEIVNCVPEEPYKMLNSMFKVVEDGVIEKEKNPSKAADIQKSVLDKIANDVKMMIDKRFWHKDNERVKLFLTQKSSSKELNNIYQIIKYPKDCPQIEAAYWFLIEIFQVFIYNDFLEDSLQRDMIKLENDGKLLSYLHQLITIKKD